MKMIHPRNVLAGLLALAAVGAWYSFTRIRAVTVPAQESLKPPPKEFAWQSLVPLIERVRKLQFKRPLKLVPVDRAELQQRLQAALAMEFPSVRENLYRRANEALGFRWQPPVPLGEALSGLRLEQDGGVFDPASGNLFLLSVAEAELPTQQLKVLNLLARVLLAQHFPTASGELLETSNDDTARARAALVMGDAQATALKCLVTQLDTSTSAPNAEQGLPSFGGTPRFLKEFVRFPASYGSYLLENLQRLHPDESVDAFYNTPLATTGEIMHLTETPPLQLTNVELPKRPPDYDAPLYQNALGEFGMLILLSSQLSLEQARVGSAGWQGDRYAVFPASGNSGTGDNLVWGSTWATEQDALEFSLSIYHTLINKFGIVPRDDFSLGAGNYHVTQACRAISVKCDLSHKTVLVLNFENELQLKAWAPP